MFKKNIDSRKLISILQGTEQQPITVKKGTKKFFISTKKRFFNVYPGKLDNSNIMEFSSVGNTEKISEKNSSRDSKQKNSSHDSKQHFIALKNTKDEDSYILPQ